MAPLRRVKLTQLNAHLVCVLCSGYFVDATTIIECLHTFCKTCIVRYLQTSSFCPICDVQVHKTKPLLSLREDRTLQDVVFKLVPGLFHSEMKRRFSFYKEHPEGGGDKTEQSLRERRHFFHVDDQISLSLEYVSSPPQSLVHSHLVKPLKVSNGQQEKQKSPSQEEKNDSVVVKEEETEGRDGADSKMPQKRYLRCPAAVQVSHLEKFVRLKYNLSPNTHRVEIMHGGDCLVGELTLLDVVYMYKWTEDAPLRLMYTVTALPQTRKRARPGGARAVAKTEPGAPPCKVPKLQLPSPEGKASPPHVSKCQDSVKGGFAVSVECQEEKPGEKEKGLPPQALVSLAAAAEKPSVATSMTPMATSVTPMNVSLSTQTVPSSSVTQISIMSCGTTPVPVPLPVHNSARARPALTTTTPATATPRVALPNMPSHTPPATVPVPIVGTNSVTPMAPAFTPKTPISLAMTSTSTVMIQTSQALVNGLSDGMKQVRGSSGPAMYANKIPHPIIPTRPRLGRPPNSSRINAAKMRPPAPRMSMTNIDVRPRPMGKKVYPSGVVTRPNSVVSASLSVQNRLSSISGPPAKLAASKVSVKRSGDVGQDGASSVQQPPVSTLSSSTSTTTTTTTTTLVSSTLTTPTQGPPTSQPPSQSVVSTTSAPAAVTAAAPTTKPASSPQQNTTVDKQTQKQCLPQSQGNINVQRPSQQPSRPPSNPTVKPAVPQGLRHPGPPPGQRQPLQQSIQRAPTPPSHPRPPTPNTQKPGAPAHQQTQITQQPSSPHLMQPPSPQGNPQTLPTGYPRAGSPAGLGAQKHPMSANQRLPNMNAQRPHLTSGPHRPPTPANTRPPSSPAPHRPSNSPAPHRSPSSSPAPLRPPINTPAPHRPPTTSPAPHRLPSNSPAPQRPPSSPAPHRAPSSPAPHRPPSSPAPHRQPGSMTPRPSSAPTPASNAVTPSSRSTPSPRCASSPSAAIPVPVSSKDTPPTLSIASPSSSATTTITTSSTATTTTSTASSAAPSSGTNTTVSNTSAPKTSKASNNGRVVPSSGNAASQTPPMKTVSPGSSKTAPKSPGRGRGASNSSTILSIAQSLANKHLQQRTATTVMSPSTNTVMNSSSIGTTQMSALQSYNTSTTSTPVYPSPSSLVPFAAAYMATYGDATPDVTMRNLITLSQAAACIREFNNLNMVKNIPRPSDPAPIDLSPTNKAAPQTPLTNGKHPPTSSSSTTTTKTNSKSPAKTSRPSTTPNTPTISPPTPEVTITKLPNTPAATSTTTPTSGTTKTTFGSVKLGSSNTNTVSITKRPASSKISVTKSPANASVRQIPNPSFVRHQSEARNNNNVSKSVSSSTANTTSTTTTTTTTNTTKTASNKHSSGSGRSSGNSPLKETGPLPDTSSILKIENLTKSLTAPPTAVPAAAASHGFAFFDNR